MEETTTTQDATVEAPQGQAEAVETQSGNTEPEAQTNAPEEGQASPDSEAIDFEELAAKKGWKSKDDAIKSYIELEKKLGNDGLTKAQVRELEEATGVPLEDLISSLKEPKTPEPTQEPDTGVDTDLFNKMVDERVNQQYGDKLSKLEKLDIRETRETFAKKYPDFNELEGEIGKFITSNPELARKDDFGLEIAYFAVKGKSIERETAKAREQGKQELLEAQAEKTTTFVESAKTQPSEAKGDALQDILNLSKDEYSKLPPEVRENILRNL